MHNNIGYHTRLDKDNTKKVSGGSFGGSVDGETVERIVKAMFTVAVKPSGRAVFVDREGRQVSLYFSIDPEQTEAGKAALAEHRQAREAAQRLEDEKACELESLLDGLTVDEALRRLKVEN